MPQSLFNFSEQSFPGAVRRRVLQSSQASTILRYVLALGAVIAVALTVHFAGVPGPLNGIISMIAVLTCAWFGGFGPALLLAPLLLLMARLVKDEPERWAPMKSQEVVGFIVVALICASIGLAGRYRRRIRAVTEQHAQKLRDQARALNQAAIVFRDVEGRVTQWSTGCERLFGWTAAEAVGQTLHELLQTRYPESLTEIQRELIDNGQWQAEVIHRHKDGSELHVAMHWILYRDQVGNPIGVAEIHNDVSELRRAEAAVREADRRKDEFLAMLAHELRNPLAPIRSGLELMKMAKNDAKLVEQTRCVMERQMQQLVTLVDDLLDVSRISRGKLELRKSQVSLSDVIQSAVEAAKPAITAAGHQLAISLPAEPVYLHADPNRLAQVVSNLLDNAAKYTARGGNIRLNARREANEVVLSIKDNGIGIPVDKLSGIFNMFTRVERSTERMHAGLGIGLALVKSIVDMHGGCVEARSEGDGGGTEIVVRLPVLSDAAAVVEQSPATATAAKPSQKRVLIVDDNQAAANLLSSVVERLGNVVRVAYDGQEAIEVADGFKPDIVLMDLAMPRLDGYEAARHIRGQPWGQEMMLVALSGWGQDGHKKRAQEAGFDHHLVKPADPGQLERLLANGRHSETKHAAIDRVVN